MRVRYLADVKCDDFHIERQVWHDIGLDFSKFQLIEVFVLDVNMSSMPTISFLFFVCLELER